MTINNDHLECCCFPFSSKIFSVAKATLQPPMSVRPSVCLKPKPPNSLKSFISPYHNIQHHSHHYTYHNTTSQHNITTQHHTQHHQAKSHTVTTIHHPHPQHTITHTNTCTITHNIKTPFISPASMLQSTAPPPSSFDFATFKLFSLLFKCVKSDDNYCSQN